MNEQTPTIIEAIASFFDGDLMKIFTGIAAIAAFCVSVYNFIVSFNSSRKRVLMRFDGIYANTSAINFKGVRCKIVKIHYSFANKSQLPIAVTRIRLIIDGEYYDSEPRPYIVERFTNSMNGELYNQDIIKSTILPIHLDALGAQSGYLAFLIPQGMMSENETTLNFEICTNRGKAVQMTFLLHEEHQLS